MYTLHSENKKPAHYLHSKNVKKKKFLKNQTNKLTNKKPVIRSILKILKVLKVKNR
jgi:hypothetical protein